MMVLFVVEIMAIPGIIMDHGLNHCKVIDRFQITYCIQHIYNMSCMASL